jgi:hypothetical protein
MSSRGWERVGAILKPLLTRLSLEDKITLSRLRREWSQVFGDPLSRHTGPAEIDKGTLVIAVDTPVWLQQLKFFRQEMLEKLNGYGIRDIRFRLGRVYRNNPDSGQAGGDAKGADRKTEPSESDLRWIDETLTPVDDEDVREALRRALKKSLTAPPPR